MRVDLLEIKSNWWRVYNAALTTLGIKDKDADFSPTSEWKKRILLAEHSPIRKYLISWKWFNLPYWVSVHFVRHKFGIEHFVQSQRPDRNNEPNNMDRELMSQGTFINHECEANAQAIINISRKRLCQQAMPETRIAWLKFLYEIRKYEPELFTTCVPDCIYRGWCYEYKSCGWHLTKDYQELLNEYRSNINNWEETKC